MTILKKIMDVMSINVCEVRTKHTGIQGVIRGGCALQVFLSHALNIYHADWVEWLNHTPLCFFIDGNCAVVVFFVLSGYFYYKEKVLSVGEYLNGIRKKCLHIFPAFWLSLIIGFLFCNYYVGLNMMGENLTGWSKAFWVSNVSITELLKSASILIPHNWDAINPASWYIQVEVEMFIIMPIVVSVYNRARNDGKWYLYLLWCVLVIGGLLYSRNMLAYLVGASFHKFKPLFDKIAMSKYCLLRIVIAVGLLNIKNEIPMVRTLPGFGSVVLIIQAIGAAVIISTIIGMDSNRFNKFKLLIFVGNISYEIYILHFIVLLILRPFFSDALLYTLMAFLICLPCSSMVHLYFKRLCYK